jgi:hypothetical protein
MITENRLIQILDDRLARQLEADRDLRSQVPSLVLIYPLDQNQLKSAFISQKWMLKLCCMATGEEHTLGGITRQCFRRMKRFIIILYLALRNISKRWTMPIANWSGAMNQFTIIFENRLPNSGFQNNSFTQII